MSKNQFTGTAAQPRRNRKFCQFNKDQYCRIVHIINLIRLVYNELSLFFQKNVDPEVCGIMGSTLKIQELYSNHNVYVCLFVRSFICLSVRPSVNTVNVT